MGQRHTLNPIAIVGLAILALFWAMVLAVDVFNVAGLGDELHRLMAQERGLPWRAALWVLLFSEGYAAEVVQWHLLGAAAGLAFFVAGRADGHDQAVSRFWLLLGIGFVMMLVEDAGNPRHYLGNYAAVVTGAEWLRTVVQNGWFLVIGVFPALAILLYGRRLWGWSGPARWYLLLGYGAYGVAVLASAGRDAWYVWMGEVVHHHLLQAQLTMVPLDREHGFYVMDYLVEESLELFGATMMAAGALAFLRQWAAAHQP